MNSNFYDTVWYEWNDDKIFRDAIADNISAEFPFVRKIYDFKSNLHNFLTSLSLQKRVEFLSLFRQKLSRKYAITNARDVDDPSALHAVFLTHLSKSGLHKESKKIFEMFPEALHSLNFYDQIISAKVNLKQLATALDKVKEVYDIQDKNHAFYTYVSHKTLENLVYFHKNYKEITSLSTYTLKSIAESNKKFKEEIRYNKQYVVQDDYPRQDTVYYFEPIVTNFGDFYPHELDSFKNYLFQYQKFFPLFSDKKLFKSPTIRQLDHDIQHGMAEKAIDAYKKLHSILYIILKIDDGTIAEYFTQRENEYFHVKREETIKKIFSNILMHHKSYNFFIKHYDLISEIHDNAQLMHIDDMFEMPLIKTLKNIILSKKFKNKLQLFDSQNKTFDCNIIFENLHRIAFKKNDQLDEFDLF